jgi:hypothetical protein
MSDEEEQQDGQPEPGGPAEVTFSGGVTLTALGGGVPVGD